MVQPLPPTTSSNDCTSAAQVVVTKATSPPLIRQNNRFFQREQALKQQLQSKTSGQKKKNGFFEYAIQADGSLFAEQQWQENRQKGGSSTIPLHFQHQSRPGGRGVVWTLQRLQQELQNCKLRHEQKQKLPEKPKEVAKKPIKLYEAATGTGTGTVPTHAPSSSPSLEGAASLSSFQANQQQQQQNPPKPYHHQASSSNPYSSANPYAAQTSQQTQPKPRNNNTNTNTGFDDVFGNDGLDDLLADMDDSMFLSQAGKSNPGYGNSSSMAPPPPRSNNPSNLTASFDYGTQQQQPLQDGMSSSSQDVGGIPLCPGHGMPCQVLTSQSAANPGRQFYKCSIKEKSEQCQFFQWADEGNMGGGGGGGAAPPHNNSSFQPSFQQSSYSGNNYSNSNNNNSSFQQMPQGNSFDNSYSASNNNAYQPMDSFNPNSGFGNNIDSDGSGGPLCPGHGLPCQILTSNSASNPGREFYKCSLPNRDEQCDFFEWVDGLGNNNNNNANPNANSTSEFSSSLWNQTRMPGAPPPNPLVGVKNIHEENKRVFGHRKFRPGQREIIENAVAGEDVFVLMPTGGGKSLCYQLPAWCCPGLAVVISPLLSLIQDQVQSMTKLGVEAVFLNSSQDYETEQRDITRRLYTTTADSGVKLLYVTPEKLRHSNMLQEILRQLYNKNLLSRFVVDEAHCMYVVVDWVVSFTSRIV